MKYYYFKYKITISSVKIKINNENTVSDGFFKTISEKIIMICNQDREVCYKCK